MHYSISGLEKGWFRCSGGGYFVFVLVSSGFVCSALRGFVPTCVYCLSIFFSFFFFMLKRGFRIIGVGYSFAKVQTKILLEVDKFIWYG